MSVSRGRVREILSGGGRIVGTRKFPVPWRYYLETRSGHRVGDGVAPACVHDLVNQGLAEKDPASASSPEIADRVEYVASEATLAPGVRR